MRIGIFGLGFMGLTHLRALRHIPELELAAVVSDNPAALSGDLSTVRGNFGAAGEPMDFSGIPRYSDPFEALEKAGLDAVDVCLPTHLHAPLVIAALRKGLHVLVEKPMARTAAECEEMLHAAADSGRILMTAQVVRFMPPYAAAARMIKEGDLGQIRTAVFRRRTAAPFWSGWLNDKKLSGGAILDMMVHDIDFCIHVFGLPDAVRATGHEDLGRGIDCVTAELIYSSIASVTVTGGWYHPKSYPFSMEYTLTGDCGTLEYSSAGAPPVLYRVDGEKQPLALAEADGFEAELRYFAECCAAGAQPEMCPPRESAAAIRIAEGVQESRSRRGERVECRF